MLTLGISSRLIIRVYGRCLKTTHFPSLEHSRQPKESEKVFKGRINIDKSIEVQLVYIHFLSFLMLVFRFIIIANNFNFWMRPWWLICFSFPLMLPHPNSTCSFELI